MLFVTVLVHPKPSEHLCQFMTMESVHAYMRMLACVFAEIKCAIVYRLIEVSLLSIGDGVEFR